MLLVLLNASCKARASLLTCERKHFTSYIYKKQLCNSDQYKISKYYEF